MSRGWGKASACRLQVSLSCAVLCQIVSLQYLSRSSLHRLGGLPCRLFLSYGLQVVTREIHRSSLRRLMCPAQGHLIVLALLIISMTFILSLTQMFVLLSLYMMLSHFFPFWSVQPPICSVRDVSQDHNKSKWSLGNGKSLLSTSHLRFVFR